MLNLQRYIGRSVEMIYMDRANQCTKRTVTIHRISGSYVICYDQGKQAFRRLRRQNILAMLPVTA